MEMGNVKKHTTLGKISLISAILVIILFCVSIAIVFISVSSGNANNLLVIGSSIISLLEFIFTLIAIILGAISFFGKDKDRYGLVAFIIGVVFILLMVITVAIAATTYVYVSGMLSPPGGTIPNIHLTRYSDALNVAFVSEPDLLWSDFEIDGSCDTSELGIYIEEGDKITSCTGTITITHKPTDRLIGEWQFE